MSQGPRAKPGEASSGVASWWCPHSKDGRNLVLDIDGTGNQFGDRNTNVVELYNLAEKSEDQLCWYNSGIGTYARPSWTSFNYYRQVIYHKIDLAIAWEFERTVMGAYRWLSDNYREGDRIFLFGFSRGAFQVRVLSAMIDKVGLIHKGNEMQIPFAYELYADLTTSEVEDVTEVGQSSDDAQKTTMASRFKSAFCHPNVKVHFVGAWDTVSSIGIIRGQHLLPSTIDGMSHVCYFRHALALDERRVKFLPEYSYGGSASPRLNNSEETPLIPIPFYIHVLCFLVVIPLAIRLFVFYATFTLVGDLTSGNNGEGISRKKLANRPQSHIHQEGLTRSNVMPERSTSKPHTLEVWFAGTHSDIGGGNVQNRGMNRSRPPLRWMVFEAGSLGFRTKSPFKRDLSSKEQIEVQESLTWPWKPLELFPFRRLTFTEPTRETYMPHLGAGRVIQPGQKLHSSLLLSGGLGTSYIPAASPPSSLVPDPVQFWKNIYTSAQHNDWLEIDLYTHIEDVLRILLLEQDRSATMLKSLQQIATWNDGRQALYHVGTELLIKGHIGTVTITSDICSKVLKTVMDVLKTNDGLQMHESTGLRMIISGLLDGDARKKGQKFLLSFTVPAQILLIESHDDWVWSVAFSPDRTRLVSGSKDSTVRIWDAETGSQIGDPLVGHNYWIVSVDISPDGEKIISSSSDGTIRLWSMQDQTQIGEPWKGNTSYAISSARFSIDGKCVASGSDDGTVRLWDVETGKQIGEPLTGHHDEVWNVKFSPDGSLVVSGSKDRTIRIWDVRSGTQVGSPLEGHDEAVWCVSVSPDGRRIVSGSNDTTIRFWDVETHQQVGEPLRGHTNAVTSVCFSPDGRFVTSGSYDGTVRIWDVEKKRQVGPPLLKDNIDWVISVAFSHDGKRIVSGTDEGTIRVWDIEDFAVWTMS